MPDSGTSARLQTAEEIDQAQATLPFGRDQKRDRSPTRRRSESLKREEDAWPWNHDGGEDLVLSTRQTDSIPSWDDAERMVASAERGEDHSATEDLILSRRNGVRPDQAAVSAQSSGPAIAGQLRRASTFKAKATHLQAPLEAPKRIGSGNLVPARLTWKPGDVFGDGAPGAKSKFRWESMLRSACITAACGLLGVWLLHSIFA